MKAWARIILILSFLITPVIYAAQVKEIRIWQETDNTRVVFDLSGPVQYQLLELDNPPRVVVDLQESELKTKIQSLSWVGTPVTALRSGVQQGKHLRLVLDLNKKVKPELTQLKPNDTYGYRLVLDLTQTKSSIPHKEVVKVKPGTRPFIVAIDAGHGGEDPGARGPSGTREKDVVLQIARTLQAAINKEPGMKAVMIRDGDYFIGLRQRIVKAREHQADLFISIHADAFTHQRAHGASVFTLSEHGASSEAARWLANSENRSDLIGGVTLDDKDKMLTHVLLDLSQTASKESSLALGQAVLTNLGQITALHGKQVQQAGFAVLKSPDIPSILVETEFISNPQGEKKLRSPDYHKEVAHSILAGIKHYVVANAHQYRDFPVAQTAKPRR